MREPADAERIRRLAHELGRAVPAGTRMYLTGGATAVLEGWRPSTVDVHVRFEPDSEEPLRRSNLEVFDFDPYSQRIEGELFRLPAVDPAGLSRAVEDLAARS